MESLIEETVKDITQYVYSAIELEGIWDDKDIDLAAKDIQILSSIKELNGILPDLMITDSGIDISENTDSYNESISNCDVEKDHFKNVEQLKLVNHDEEINSFLFGVKSFVADEVSYQHNEEINKFIFGEDYVADNLDDSFDDNSQTPIQVERYCISSIY